VKQSHTKYTSATQR